VRTLIVLAHPEIDSFNAQMAELAKRVLSHESIGGAEILDLYRANFDPVERAEHYANHLDPTRFDAQAEQRHASDTGTLPSDVIAHLEAVERADLLILQYPMWWYTPPAILKGWLDRVFVYGRTYTSRMRYDAGCFRGKRAMLSVTTGGPQATYQYNGRNGDIDLLLWPLHFTLYYVGFTVLTPFVAFGVEGGLKYSPEEEARHRLAEYQRRYQEVLADLDSRPTIPFNCWSDWDEAGRLKPGAPGFSPFMRSRP
jgi:NAD(P)H dehydrogenase (quinone)